MPQDKPKKPLAPNKKADKDKKAKKKDEDKLSARQGSNFIAVQVDYIGKILHSGVFLLVVSCALLSLVIVGGSIYEYNLQTKLDAYENNLSALANQLRGESEFENQFVTLQRKLQALSDIDQSERMADFFPFLSALLPNGVKISGIIITPESVVVETISNNNEYFADFVGNIRAADGYQFSDGSQLSIINLNFRNVMQDATRVRSGDAAAQYAYAASVSFNYKIEKSASWYVIRKKIITRQH